MSELQTITVLNGTKDINNSFQGLLNLTTLNLPTTLSSFKTNSLSGTKIPSIRTNDTVCLCSNCFAGMTRLDDLVFALNNSKVADNIGLSTTNIKQISCITQNGSEIKQQFRNLTQLKSLNFTNHGSDISTLPNYCFENDRSLIEFDIGNSKIYAIPSYAFNGCRLLSSLYLPDNQITAYQTNCFNQCNNLTYIPDYSKVIHAYNIGSFATLKINNIDASKITTIDANAFKNLSSNLENFNFNKLNTLENNAFERSRINNISIIFSNTSTNKTIPENCFYDSSIQTFTTNATTISSQSFSNCQNLTSISIPSVTLIGEQALFNTSLLSVEFASGITLCANSFENQNSLTGISFNDNNILLPTTSADFNARIRNANFSTNVTKVSCLNCSFINSGFDPSNWNDQNEVHTKYDNLMMHIFNRNIEKNVTFYFDDYRTGFTYNSTRTMYSCLSLDNPEFQNQKLLSIITDTNKDYKDFNNNTNKAKLPDSISSVESGAYNMTKSSLSTTNFNRATNIAVGLFNNEFTKLTSIYGENISLLSAGVLSGISALTTVNFSNATKISSEAFKNDINLTTFEGGLDKVTTTYLSSFAGCSSLKNVPSVSRLATIGQSTFENCTDLQSIQSLIDSQLTSIRDKAFYNCISLSSIPSIGTLKEIRSSAFISCTNLLNIQKMDNLSFINNSSFRDCINLLDIYSIPNLTSIGTSAFANCIELSTISQMDSLIYINDYAFASCTSLSTLSSINTLQEIRPAAFQYCTNLRNVQSMTNLQLIGNSAFNACNKLSTIQATNSLTAINQYAFNNCTSLESIESIPNLQTIGNATFRNCQSLTSWQSFVNSRLTSISPSAFHSCIGLTQLDSIPTLQKINSYAFQNCTGLTSLQLGNSPNLTSIESNAFKGCNNLRSITIGNNANAPTIDIKENAFNGCTSLTSISLQQNILAINATAFNSCTNVNQFNSYKLTNLNGGNQFANFTNTLSVKFNQCNQKDILTANGIVCEDIRSILSVQSSVLGSPKDNTKIYTNENNYTYPSMIVNNGNIYIVRNKSFIVDNQLKLDSIGITDSPTNPITPSDLSGIQSIKVTAFQNTNYQSIKFLSTAQLSSTSFVPQNTFSGTNAPTIRIIYVDENFSSYSESVQNTIKNWLYTKQLGQNDNIDIQYKDGYIIRGGNIIITDDPFLYNANNGDIIGVNDYLVRDGKIISINSLHKCISAYAFSKTMALHEIQNFTAVSVIENNAFSDSNAISNISLRNNTGFIQLGEHTFDRSGLQVIDIHLSSTTLGNTLISGYGLNNSTLLQHIIYGAEVSAIAPSAMIDYSSGLSSITFSNNIIQIGDAAFAKFYDRFPQLKNVTLNNMTQLSIIGDYAFYNSIVDAPDHTLKLPRNLLSVGAASFAYRQEAWTQEDLLCAEQEIENVQTGARLRYIGPSAFMNSSFRNIKFGSGLSIIGDYAFAYPKHKFDINIIGDIQSIGENAFKGNIILNPQNIAKNIVKIRKSYNKLSSVFGISLNAEFEGENRPGFTDDTVISAIGNNNNFYNSFIYVTGNKLKFCPPGLSIDLINRTLVNVEDTITSSFIPQYISYIAPSAFANCTQLTSISANDSLSIGNAAFYNCTSLKTIIPPNGDIYHLCGMIANDAFNGCNNLSNIELLSSIESIGDRAFSNCTSISILFSEDTLKQKDYWSLTSIGDNSFDGCSNLIEFDIPLSTVHFGRNIFKDCTNLKNVNIAMTPDKFLEYVEATDISNAIVDVFGYSASNNPKPIFRLNFDGISYTSDGIVKIDNNLVLISSYIQDSIELSSVVSVDSERFIEEGFHYMNLSGISRVGKFAFANMAPDSNGEDNGRGILNTISFISLDNKYLSDIEDYAFSGCRELQTINRNELSCTTIGQYAFANCQKMLQMTISYPTLSSIGLGAFYNTSLNKLIISNIPYQNNPQNIQGILDAFKNKIGYNTSTNINPLELPDYCTIYFKDVNGNEIGKYDYQLHSISHQTIDINRNMITFTDKTKSSIRPLLLVKTTGNQLPSIAANTFHANVVGRWK